MLTKNQIKHINKLKTKKHRKAEGEFIAEGKKVIRELLASDLELKAAYATSNFLESPKQFDLITDKQLKQITALSTPQLALAVFKIPESKPINTSGLVLALDDIRDPGNLGTIIRLCDWYGITDLVCSTKTVDCYNPKVVQASMGSLARVNIQYVDLPEFLSGLNDIERYGAFLEGDVVYNLKLPKQGVLILGNEANGIRTDVEALITQKINIPQFGAQTTESLNVATATAVLLNEFKRQYY